MMKRITAITFSLVVLTALITATLASCQKQNPPVVTPSKKATWRNAKMQVVTIE
jgi:hypothetical protein